MDYRASDIRWAAACLGGVVSLVLAADPYQNPSMRPGYPEHNYEFQDHRAIWDIFAERLSPELLSNDPDWLGRPAMCWDENTPSDSPAIAKVEAMMRSGGGYQGRYNVSNRWPIGGQGDAIMLTWSFVPDGTIVGDDNAVGGAGASEIFSRMDSKFGAANRQVWISKIQQCFDRWSALTGVTYVRIRYNGNEWDDGAAWGNVGSATRGDVRIGMKAIDSTGNILAYNYYPADGGDMVLDRWESWQSSTNNYRYLRNVVMHEHGHGLGLAHVCPRGTDASTWKIMEPILNTSFDGPQQDDIRGVQFYYGDPYEMNNSVDTATNIGALTAGTALTMGDAPAPTPPNSSVLAVEGALKTDYFKFTLDRPRLVDISVNPVGTSYLAGTQIGNCTTDPYPTVDALGALNLAFDVRNDTNTAVYRVVNAAAPGLTEATTGLLLPAGTNVLRVYNPGGGSASQEYKFTLLAQTVSLAPSASDGTIGDKVRVTWPGVITDATGYQIVRNGTNSLTGAVQVGQVGAGVTQFDDTTAAVNTTYYYWVRAQQPGNSGYRYMTTDGDAGFRANQSPVANAGPDQIVYDYERDGVEPVTLNAGASTDPDGTITSYAWSENAAPIAAGPSPTVVLEVGVHTVTLTVTDNASATATDTVVIDVRTPCAADYNSDGGIDGGDVDAFFADWGAGLPAADVNGDGGVDGADVSVFFEAWEAGGC
ncbi:MAG: matrixin family metalloprotease [Planctomycetes bacterium]|nr:matrixin family metalloprotease [Planctomycetota bacterium]